MLYICRRYYKHQDSLIAQFEDLDLGVDDAMENTEEQAKIKKVARRLSKVSFFANLVRFPWQYDSFIFLLSSVSEEDCKRTYFLSQVLLIIKTVAAILSGSLSIISAVIDSAVDLVSGALMWWSNKAMKYRDPYAYPQGKTPN